MMHHTKVTMIERVINREQTPPAGVAIAHTYIYYPFFFFSVSQSIFALDDRVDVHPHRTTRRGSDYLFCKE
jgi:hypothetical protein